MVFIIWIFLPKTTSCKALSASSVKQVNSALWHMRLGHASTAVLHKISHVAPHLVDDNLKACLVYPLSKQTNLPFPVSTSHATGLFDLIHVDLWGPYRHETHTGCKYFLTIVDDHSRAVWTYLLPTKQHATAQLFRFFSYVQQQFGKSVKTFRSDHGTEFFNQTLVSYLLDKGICQQASCVNTPAQNGRVERKHRQILNIARSLRFHSGLPIKYWGECILTASYIINRLPSPILDYKTPFQCLYNDVPDYSLLKVFGCLCFASTHDTDKFDPRALRCVFMGYLFDHKGYKLLNLETKQMFISRHVVFHETTFPFLSKIDKAQSPDATFVQEWLYLPVSPHVPLVSDMPGETTDMSTDMSADMSFTSSPQNTHRSSSPVSPGDGASPVHSGENSSAGHLDSIPDWNTSPPDLDTLINLTPEVDDVSVDLPRKSTRAVTRPVWWSDYVVPTSSNNVVKYPIQNYISTHSFAPDHAAFLVKISKQVEPKNFAQAVKDPNWVSAMNKELDALEADHTWDLVPLPPGKKTIGCRWVYKIKYHANGEVERFKARLVAKGYTQEEGVDFHDTFAPVAKGVTVKSVFAVTAIKGWSVFQLDINNAFLHGNLHEEVYMDIPLGYNVSGISNLVCRLVKSIYGLRQASREWNTKLKDFLIDFGFHQSLADYSLFIHKQGSSYILAVVYVDDILLTGNNVSLIDTLKAALHSAFSIKDLGEAKYYLGLEVSRSSDGIMLSQKKFILDMLQSANLLDAKPLSIPLDQHVKMYDNDKSGRLIDNPLLYRSLVGKMLYLTFTRPDISYSVHLLSQYMQAPREKHLSAVFRVLRYLKCTAGLGLFFQSNNSLVLQGFCDSDWGGCTSTGRSVTGYCLQLGSALISWQAKKQSVTSLSTTEAEYRALATVTTEVMWLKSLLADLNISTDYVVSIFCDNQAAIDIALNPVQHARTKHIELDCYFVREKVHSKIIMPQKIASKFQLADIFTKALGGTAHWFICSKLGLHNPCVTPTCGGNIADKDTSETAVQAQVYNVVLDNMNRVQYKASIFKAMKGQINTELLYYVWC